MVAVDRNRIASLAAGGNRRARVVETALHHLSFELSGAQLGITATSLVLGFVAEPTIGRAVEPLLDAIPGVSTDAADATSVVAALAIATVTQMLVAELIPKNFALARPLGVALWVGPPHRLMTVVATPLIRLLNGAANATVRRLGIEPREELRNVRTLDELELLIETSEEEGTITQVERALLTRMIRFTEKTAADALVPRTSVTALDRSATVDDLAQAARSTGFSRFPVVGKDLDDVVGVVHVRSVHRVPRGERSATSVEVVMDEPFVVPESRPLDELLGDLRSGRSQLAIVIDEYGGTAGIITTEDILEEVVGDIRDEFDREVETRLTAPVQPGTHTLDGSLHRDEVEDLIGLELPEGDFETLAGYLLVLFDRVPDVGDRVAGAGWTFEVLEMDRLRIARVRATPPDVDPAATS